nr:PREDICTED: NADPH:adrenodoxin oxidoreductase, mitochondrial isoform X5 [Megachile rotundata]
MNKKFGTICNYIRLFSTEPIVPKVCIVGAGPAGFYAAQQLLKTSSDVKVDVLEKLPVPFGLVRFGVAPDHPEVKNVIHTFEKTASNPRFQFIGNVNVGKDVTLKELQEMYHAVLLTFGAEADRALGIPGENLNNIISGRRFVGWYNGIPADSNLDINLDIEEAIILGQGRRGPLQAAFTIAELREMLKLEGCHTYWRKDDFSGVKEVVSSLARPRKRLTELMLKHVEEVPLEPRNSKEFHPIFLRSPTEFLGSNSVNSIKFAITKLEGDDIPKQVAVPTGSFEEMPCNLAFRSIGYKSVQIDKLIPFDDKAGRVKNIEGKVQDKLYAAGWAATGPVGVILSTMTNALQIGALISKELSIVENKSGSEGLFEILKYKNVPVVSYNGWKKIDKAECERGKLLGKPREKIVNINEMLEIASN